MSDLTYASIFLSALINQVRKELQVRDSSNFVTRDPIYRLRESRTITLGLPRQSGKTTAVFNAASKQKSVILVPTHAMAHAYRQLAERQNYNVPIIPADQMIISGSSQASKEDPLRLVLVDEYALVNMDIIYAELNRMYISGHLSSDFLVVRTGT